MARYVFYIFARCANVCLGIGWDCVGRLGILRMEEASFYRLVREVQVGLKLKYLWVSGGLGCNTTSYGL